MFKTKLFNSVEIYAMLDLEVAYNNFLETILQEVRKRALLDEECDVKKYILNKNFPKFTEMFKSLLNRIEKKEFDYEELMFFIKEFDEMIENIDF